MPHDWIFDVLADLRLYALKNEMPGLAGKVEEAMRTARREIAAARLRGSEDDEADDETPRPRPN